MSKMPTNTAIALIAGLKTCPAVNCGQAVGSGFAGSAAAISSATIADVTVTIGMLAKTMKACRLLPNRL